MTKVYEMAKWEFSVKTMRRLGINEKWVYFMMICVSMVSYSILITWVRSSIFNSIRGLRKGDPLLPYLFVIFAKALSALLYEVEYNHSFYVPFGSGIEYEIKVWN